MLLFVEVCNMKSFCKDFVRLEKFLGKILIEKKIVF